MAVLPIDKQKRATSNWKLAPAMWGALQKYRAAVAVGIGLSVGITAMGTAWSMIATDRKHHEEAGTEQYSEEPLKSKAH